MDVKKISIQELVDKAINIDKKLKEDKRTLDAIKAEIQARGLREIEDKNIKYVKYFSTAGSVAVIGKQSLDVINVDKLKELISEGVWKSKVVEETKTTYKYDKKLEAMLKAVFTGDYSFSQTLEDFLDTIPDKPDAKQKKLLLKKLKGDYVTDRKTLISVLRGYEEDDDEAFDEELYYICMIKNAELIKTFLSEEGLDGTLEDIKKCLTVDFTTGITLDYDKEDN